MCRGSHVRVSQGPFLSPWLLKTKKKESFEASFEVSAGDATQHKAYVIRHP